MTSQELKRPFLQDLKLKVNESLLAMKPFATQTSPEWNLETPVKAVIFDIYGTVLISGSGDIGISQEKQNLFPSHEVLKKNGCSFNYVDQDYRIKDLLITEIEKSHESLKLQGSEYPEVDIISIWESVLETLIEDKLIDCTLNLDTIAKIALDYELLVNPVWPMPGIHSILEGLRKKGFCLGIVSNAQFYTPLTIEALLEASLEELGFDNQYCFWSFAHRTAKPSSLLFRKLTDVLKKDKDIKPHEILYIGNDMLNDVYAAQFAGLKTALFAGDMRSLRLRQSYDCCKELKPDIILTEWKQLERLLTDNGKEL